MSTTFTFTFLDYPPCGQRQKVTGICGNSFISAEYSDDLLDGIHILPENPPSSSHITLHQYMVIPAMRPAFKSFHVFIQVDIEKNNTVPTAVVKFKKVKNKC
jgi:hypothetical protein